jgi:7-carboxy-7-deazaguanine synthase
MLETAEKALTVAERQRTNILRVNEIFYSIQGEGTRAGERCVFVRLTGCGLRCTYCDTEYAFYEGTDASVDSVLETIQSFNCTLVELTGGEPLEQEAAYPLMDRLLAAGHDVMIETGGHVDIRRVDTRVKRIVDLKTPSSGMSKRNVFDNIAQMTKHDEVKMIAHFEIAKNAGTILLSPVSGTQGLDELSAWILADSLPVRLQVQLHKLIWPGVERGV